MEKGHRLVKILFLLCSIRKTLEGLLEDATGTYLSYCIGGSIELDQGMEKIKKDLVAELKNQAIFWISERLKCDFDLEEAYVKELKARIYAFLRMADIVQDIELDPEIKLFEMKNKVMGNVDDLKFILKKYSSEMQIDTLNRVINFLSDFFINCKQREHDETSD